VDHLLAKRGKGKLIYRLDDLQAVKPTVAIACDLEVHGGSKGDVGNPSYAGHGICGIALCTTNGDAVYLVIDDGRSFSGIPIAQAIEYLNKHWFTPGRILVLHNSKYDLGFLVSRGADVSKTKLVDTWVLSSIKNECVYVSNKLKDVMRDRFKVETESEEVIKKWLLEHKTENYGDLPVELVGPYAADDVLYTLVFYFSMLSSGVNQDEWIVHDRMVRNNLCLNKAEARGIAVNRPLLKERLDRLERIQREGAQFITEALGAMKVDVYDQNAMMTMLHSKGLHSEPKDWYGEKKYVLDDEFLLGTKSELAKEYCWFARRQNFLRNFSGQKGIMGTRIWLREHTAGFHLNHFPSMHAKGGLPQVRLPDFTEGTGLRLNNEIRELFIPRPGHKFVKVHFCDLPALLLAYYTKDTELLSAVQQRMDFMEFLAQRARMLPGPSDWREAISLWLLKEYQGSGDGVFEKRLKASATKLKGMNHYKVRDTVAAALRCKDGKASYAEFKNALEKTFATQALLDRGGRRVRPEEKKRWRGFAILMQSSAGGIISIYLDVLCALAQRTGAHLVLAHEEELLFECELDNKEFEVAVAQLAVTPLVEPAPVIHVALQSAWQSEGLDAHVQAYRRLVP